MIKFLLRFLFKLTGIPSFFLFIRQRYYYENPSKKTPIVKGKAIFISNHTHILDFFTIIFMHPFRRQRMLVSEAIYSHPFLGFMCKIMNCICVHRERSDLSFFSEAENTLSKGGVITIFPEGHLVKNGKLDSFKPSVVYLALRSGAPIIPHYIEPHYGSLKRTRIIMGEPIYLKDYVKSDKPSTEEVKELCELLRNKTLELKRKMNLYKKYHTKDLFYSKSWFLELTKFLLFIPTKIIFPTRFHYVDGATKKDRKIKGRGLIASKHRGFSDAPILAMHYLSRRVHIVVGKEIYDTMPFILKHLLSIKYDRNTASSDPSCFLEVINTLKAEGVVGIYPEGHIKPNELGEFHDGTAYFSIMSRSPIYFYYMIKPYKLFHINHVLISKSIDPKNIFTEEELKDKKTISAFTDIIKEQFIKLENEGRKYIKVKNK